MPGAAGATSRSGVHQCAPRSRSTRSIKTVIIILFVLSVEPSWRGQASKRHFCRMAATASLTRAICWALASSIQRGLRPISTPYRASTLLMRAIGACTSPLLSGCSVDGAPPESAIRKMGRVCVQATDPDATSRLLRTRDGRERVERGGIEPPGNPQLAGPPRWAEGAGNKKAAPSAAPQ